MKLQASPDPSVRPTKAIVRKSLFQRLEPWTGRRVCDLYAGIGALGLEALSRGARHVTFVEQDRALVAVLKQNLARARAGDNHRVITGSVSAFLAAALRQFDVLLADPPYNSVTWAELQPLAEGVLAPGGVFAMELPRQAEVPAGLDVRYFGKSKVALWTRLP